MAVSQLEKELDTAFHTAKQLKEKIKENYISKPSNIYLKKNELQEEIKQFVTSNRKIINRYIENKTTTEDLLLAQIMRQFLSINKIIESYKQTKKFFPTNKSSFIKQLENHLKTIEEELNKLPSENNSQLSQEYLGLKY